jgi:FKBP-type peptidyl-prolyl cis-trans isomerase SlyD
MSDKIEAGKVVGFHYTLKNDAGEVLDSSSGGEPLQYLHGAGNIVPGLETELTGKAVGDDLSVTVQPADGYGERDEQMVHHVAKAQFPDGMEIEVGMQFGMYGPGGQPIPVWVTAIEGDTVTIDMNHPLAGSKLHFQVKITSVREATAEEQQHGHPHGPDGGHSHGH